MSRCRECGLPMVDMGYPEHPACDPHDVNAAIIRARHKAWRLAVTGQQQDTVPTSALGIIRRWALRNRTFSSNDLREAFDRAGVPKNSRGPAFVAAQNQKPPWIEREGHEQSTDPGTKRHDVKVYRSLCYVAEGVAS